MGTVIQDMPHINHGSQPRWDRFERADLFEQYRKLRTQGISERQAAKELKVPRTTLQAWRIWHDTLDSCPHVAEFFQSSPGLAFLHRIVIAFHLVCVEVGACGIRLVCLFLNLTGLDRFVAASYGAQRQVNLQVEQAMVAYGQDETAHLAQGMPQKEVAYPHVADNVSRLLQAVCVMSLSQSSGLTSDLQSIVQPSLPACGHGFPALLHERFPG